jgi:acyl carrier protein
VVIAGATPKNSHTEEIIAFILYRKEIEDFISVSEEVRSQIAEQIGLELDKVIPVSRIPKTTSGKVQRAKLLQSYFDGEFESVLSELQSVTLKISSEVNIEKDELLTDLLKICSEFIKEREVGADDNLFEIGVTSLTLVEIVLAIDEKYPQILDISDLFDYPTLREVSIFMKEKL